MKIAIVHDWLVVYAGAERVLEQILQLFPDADLFSIIDFLPVQQRAFLHNRKVTTSFIQNVPYARTKYRAYLALMPIAVEQFDLSGYDVVISSSYAVAKGVLTGPDQVHISYVHSPIRYAWDMQHQYLQESNFGSLKSWIAKIILHYIRQWDYRTANGVDDFIANSHFIARRIKKVYGRESTVIYPPVDISAFTFSDTKGDYYLTASRLVPYKKIDLIVEAFSAMPDKQLVVIGDGPDYGKIAAKAADNIHLLGYQSSDSLKSHMQKARAFVFAAEEDFGIIPVEAQACGTPVIAFGKGGVLETVLGATVDHPTGVFFEAQTVESIVNAVHRFENIESKMQPALCRDNAMRFSVSRFRYEFSTHVKLTLNRIRSQYNGWKDVV